MLYWKDGSRKMKAAMSALRPLTVLVTAFAISACGSPGGTAAIVGVGNVAKNNAHTLPVDVITISIPKHSASSVSSTLSSFPQAKIRVPPFNDDRKDLNIEGESKAAFGVPMGHIRFNPSPATLLGQVITSEVRAAGHALTDSGEDTQITGSVLQFETHTDATLLYWDITGNLAVSLQISDARGTNPGAPIYYQIRCTDRTYVWPKETVISGVMSKCMNDFASTLRTDGRAANALRTALARGHDLAEKAMAESARVDNERPAITTQPSAVTDKSYTSSNHRWLASYPADWKLDANDRYVKISKGQAILGIHDLTDVAGNSLDEVADATVQKWEQQMKNVNIVRRISRQRITLAGDVAGIAIVHHIGTGQIGQSRKIIAVVKDRGYLIDAETLLASWPDYERNFNSIINSFRVLQ